jgi:CubicO group peptidase (beta-lactamase class C family)
MMRPTAILVPLLFSFIAANDVIDLSADLETGNLVNPGSAAITATASALSEIRTALVLEHGKIVAEYTRDDLDPNDLYQVWSTTKSWMSMLFGFAVEEGLIGLEETLGEIFTNESVWAELNATEVDFKMNVTIFEMLTMTSGLNNPVLDNPALANMTAALEDGGDAGGGTLVGSLAWPSVGEKGIFHYLGVSNILSYVLQERTGMSPREYLAQKVLPAFGLQDSNIDWWQNADGLEYAYHGLELTAKQMAKFGQLYLQGGLSAPDTQLLKPEWVSNSTSVQVEEATIVSPADPSIKLTGKYGYLFWIINGSNIGAPNTGQFYCTIGLGGQDICVDLELDRVSVQQRDFEDGAGNLIIAAAALDKNISFEGVEGGNTSTMTSGSKWMYPFSFLAGLVAFIYSVSAVIAMIYE